MIVLLLPFCKGTRERDAEFRRLYVEGSAYLRDTRIELEKVKTADSAASVIENSLPRLEKLVQRKKDLERRHPEITESAGREKYHAQFPEFNQLRTDLRGFMAYGQTLLIKYKSHDRFYTAVRKGMALMNYF